MAINLQKGQKINLGLTHMTVGLGWEPNEGTGFEFDLDVSAIMINDGRLIPAENFFIFYGNLTSPDGALEHTGDNPDGQGDGDDEESIIIDLSKVDERIQEILFVVTIDEYEARKQNFGQVRNSYIRLLDTAKNNEVVAIYELDEDFSIETGVEFGRLYKRGGAWKFEASGIGYKEDLAFFLQKYYKGDIIK